MTDPRFVLFIGVVVDGLVFSVDLVG